MKKHCLLLIGLFAVILSCKKKNEPIPNMTKSYLKSYSEGNALRQFNYDNQNRVSSMIYSEPGITQSTEINGYDNSGNITTYTIRTSGSMQVFKISVFYDSQNRISNTERRDSATNTITQVITYTYTSATTTRENRNGAGLLINRTVYTYDTNRNLIKEESFNGAGTPLLTYNFNNYDDKFSPQNLIPLLFRNGVFYNNNYQTYTTINHSTGITRNYSASYTYNTDGYPTQQLINTSPIFATDYIYEKR